MCGPITDEFPVEEPFRKEIVSEYLLNKDTFTKYPLRHYSQLEITFEEEQVRTLLNRLNIPIMNTRVTIFGGYTGQFATCLRDIGMQMIFTDPLEEWVKEAVESGFEAYRCTAEEIPGNIVQRTDLFATFECYPPLKGPGTNYTKLRFLTSRYGILFANSKRTRDEMKKEGATVMLKASFRPFSKIYSIKRVHRETKGLRFCHFCSDKINREKIKMDCRVMKLIWGHFPNRTRFNKENIASFCHKTEMNKEKFLDSLKRIFGLYQVGVPRCFRHIFRDVFPIFSKRFYVDLKILKME